MFKSGRILYVLFTCQQAIENILKALVIQATKRFPPRIHDLVRLAKLAKIDLTGKQEQFLAKLNFYYLESRYPEQIIGLSKDITEKIAGIYFSESKEIIKWLKTKLH